MTEQLKYIFFAVLCSLLLIAILYFFVFKKETFYNPLNNTVFNVDSPNWSWQKLDDEDYEPVHNQHHSKDYIQEKTCY